jgi:small subunit ribosomal protein S20
MPIIKSAKKRVRVARKATVRNVKTKRSLKTALKSFQSTLTGGKASTKSAAAKSKAQSELDKAAKKNVMHKNKVARKQRQLAAAAKKAGVKVEDSKKAAKPAAKKAAPAKKAPAKKPATKKPAAKKTTKK